MGRGTEVFGAIMRRAEEEGSIEERRRKVRPEMRLAPDVVVEADDETRSREVLGQLGAEGVNCIEVRDEESGVNAVLLSAERYVELMTRLLAAEPTIGDDRRLHPRSLADSNLEQVDANASWDAYFRFNPRASK